jgi:hypothetical protein
MLACALPGVTAIRITVCESGSASIIAAASRPRVIRKPSRVGIMLSVSDHVCPETDMTGAVDPRFAKSVPSTGMVSRRVASKCRSSPGIDPGFQ